MDYLGGWAGLKSARFGIPSLTKRSPYLVIETQATEANDRQQILRDGYFWGRLEYMASGWLAESPHTVHRKYWIDGFVPQAIINTKTGMVVTGYVWMARGSEWQSKWECFPELPQRLVHKRNRPFEIETVWIDEEEETLDIKLAVLASSPE